MPSKPKSQRLARVVASRHVFSGPVFSVVSQRVKEPDGVEVRRDVVRHHGSIVILAVDDSTRVPRVLAVDATRHWLLLADAGVLVLGKFATARVSSD